VIEAPRAVLVAAAAHSLLLCGCLYSKAHAKLGGGGTCVADAAMTESSVGLALVNVNARVLAFCGVAATAFAEAAIVLRERL
jgi:hypothetical protein